MTALHPGASRSPDRTGLCRAGRSAPSQCEMVTGPGFSSPNQPNQERTTVYRDSSGPNSRSDAHYATIVGDWEEASGEFRLNGLDSERGIAYDMRKIAEQKCGAPSPGSVAAADRQRISRRQSRALSRRSSSHTFACSRGVLQRLDFTHRVLSQTLTEGAPWLSSNVPRKRGLIWTKKSEKTI